VEYSADQVFLLELEIARRLNIPFCWFCASRLALVFRRFLKVGPPFSRMTFWSASFKLPEATRLHLVAQGVEFFLPSACDPRSESRCWPATLSLIRGAPGKR